VSTFTISKVTLYSLLLAMMVALTIWTSSQGHRDGCAAYLAGDRTAPSTEYIVTGTRTVVVSCNQWLPRQPTWVQMLCLVELVLIATFLLNGLGNVRDWLERRRRLRGLS